MAQGRRGIHGGASLTCTAWPPTSAPASGDRRRKDGADSIAMAPTPATASEKSSGVSWVSPRTASSG
jgi:hypothetical protein